jgi:8-oxo-dGTP pyrophosphatase MutT (NUDIX family)
MLFLLFALLFSQTNTQEEERAGIILRHGDRYLLVQNGLTRKWSFTKGHVEPWDINLLETATREVREEAGFTEIEQYTILAGPCYIGRTNYWFGSAHNTTTPTLNNVEQIGAGWFTPKEIIALDGNKDVRAWIKAGMPYQTK